MIQRERVPMTKVVLTGPLLHTFKITAPYETTASHLAFVEANSMKALLLICKIEEGDLPPILRDLQADHSLPEDILVTMSSLPSTTHIEIEGQ